METEHERIIAIDVSCECGAEAFGLWSAAEVEDWQDEHESLKERLADDGNT